MLDALRPAHVRDVDQAVDALGDLDEGAELRQVADLALDDRALGVGVVELLPGVALGLAQRQADAPLIHVELGDDRLHLVADLEDLGRVDDLLGPRHLADVDQPFDALLDLDEGAVVDQRHDAATHPRADRVLLVDQRPRVVALRRVEGETAHQPRLEGARQFQGARHPDIAAVRHAHQSTERPTFVSTALR